MQKRESKSGAWAGPLTADTGDEGIGVTLSRSMWMHQIQALLQEDASLKLRVVTALSAGCVHRTSGLSMSPGGSLSSVHFYTELWLLLTTVTSASAGIGFQLPPFFFCSGISLRDR